LAVRIEHGTVSGGELKAAGHTDHDDRTGGDGGRPGRAWTAETSRRPTNTAPKIRTTAVQRWVSGQIPVLAGPGWSAAANIHHSRSAPAGAGERRREAARGGEAEQPGNLCTGWPGSSTTRVDTTFPSHGRTSELVGSTRTLGPVDEGSLNHPSLLARWIALRVTRGRWRGRFFSGVVVVGRTGRTAPIGCWSG
jgi:hypothetical protein